jgi:molybdopterin molybdotransferase
MGEALSLEDAQARLLALAPDLPSETVPTDQTLGRYLAEDLRATRTQPPADLSAMDGYALCGSGPWLRVGESRAGAPFAGEIALGQCVRISTGAHVPQGADRVLLKEDAELSESRVIATNVPPPGSHIRSCGFDFREGGILLERGAVMTAARIALALAAGRGTLAVANRARVAILETGDELAADPAQCAPHQIPASNGAMLAAMLAPLGCLVTQLGPVGDDLAAIERALLQAGDADLVITSGGASVGDHDHVQAALEQVGATLAFWRVAIKPGKPILVATRGRQIIIGLPGNPASCFVTCFFFALPLLRAAMGARDPLPSVMPMLIGHDLPKVGKRREFLRAARNGDMLRTVESQDSSALRSLAEADCLIDRAAGSPALASGAQVAAFPLHFG